MADDKVDRAANACNIVTKLDHNLSWEDKFLSFPIEGLIDDLHKIKAFGRNEFNKKIITESLNEILNAFINILIGDIRINNKRIKSLCDDLFCHIDLYFLILSRLKTRMNDLRKSNHCWNVYHFLRYIRVPTKKLQNNFYSDKNNMVIKTNKQKKKIRNLFEEAWLSLIKHKLPNTLIKRLVPYLSGTVLSAMKNGQLAGDFLFRIFNLGDIFSILSLEGIFKLITEHNFEYPNFYKSVYRITTPFICYLSYREKFLNLLDTFLSSTHLPAYIVASFVKKLSRLALYAPFSFQEPLLALIQNLLIRHDTLHFLLHRDEPATFEMDPYDMDNVSLKENGALLSSLWEIKMLQKHWLFDITKRTSFVDKGISSMESFLRWKSSDNYFDQIMQKKFGKDLAKNGLENKFINNQTGHDDNNDDEGDFSDEPKNKRRKMASNNRQSKNNYEVPIKENEPDKEFFSFLTCKVDF